MLKTLQSLGLGLLVLTVLLVLTGTGPLEAASKKAKAASKEAAPKELPAPLSATTFFANPEEAGAALIQAATQHDRSALIAILGGDAKELLGLEDDPATTEELDAFVKTYTTRHEWREINDFQILLIGEDQWPFPIPLARTTGSQWAFDAQSGQDELALRRLGRNELDTMETCRAYFEAQMDYYRLNPEKAETPRYAARLVSSPGRKDGLYWPTENSEEAPSPLGELLAQADRAATPPDTRQPYYGYYFKALAGQGPQAPGGAWAYVVDGQAIGGFALLAYPAEYGRSGVMSFMISQSGQLYEKDQGPQTEKLAAKQTLFNPDSGWTLVPER